jgi:hypothetical protein
MSEEDRATFEAALHRADKSEKALLAAMRSEDAKIKTLRLIFIGIAALMGYLGMLVTVNWYVPGSVDADGVGMAFFQTSKDILLVLTGILGSAMASVFDSRSSGGRSGDGFVVKPQATPQAEEAHQES